MGTKKTYKKGTRHKERHYIIINCLIQENITKHIQKKWVLMTGFLKVQN